MINKILKIYEDKYVLKKTKCTEILTSSPLKSLNLGYFFNIAASVIGLSEFLISLMRFALVSSVNFSMSSLFVSLGIFSASSET